MATGVYLLCGNGFRVWLLRCRIHPTSKLMTNADRTGDTIADIKAVVIYRESWMTYTLWNCDVTRPKGLKNDIRYCYHYFIPLLLVFLYICLGLYIFFRCAMADRILFWILQWTKLQYWDVHSKRLIRPPFSVFFYTTALFFELRLKLLNLFWEIGTTLSWALWRSIRLFNHGNYIQKFNYT